jgi:hypothetical protein
MEKDKDKKKLRNRQRLYEAQQEIFTAGAFIRLILGPYWQPPFGMFPILDQCQ